VVGSRRRMRRRRRRRRRRGETSGGELVGSDRKIASSVSEGGREGGRGEKSGGVG